MKIEFLAGTEYVSKFVQGPKPAYQYIPSWYKELPTPKDSSIKYIDGKLQNGHLKACLPFMDALTSGYIQETWVDIRISNDNGLVNYGYESGPQPMAHREKISGVIGDAFYPFEFIWSNYWHARLPKGYSLLITHPFNRLDLPFTTMTGVVDADSFHHTPMGNIPFFIHKGFDGIIPAGTPMFQIFPFRRDEWHSSFPAFDADDMERRNRQIRKYIWGGYRKLFWQKKKYT